MADSDLAELRKQCITSLYLCTDNVSKYVDTEKEIQFDKLKSYVEGYCLLEAHQEVAIQALERAKQEISNIDSLENSFEAHLTTLAGENLDVENHPYMIELNKLINKGMQSTRHNVDESDVAYTGSQDQYIDPITKQPLVDPVKNSICGHNYGKESIINLITTNPRTKCPVVGCGNRNPVRRQHLIPDNELALRIARTQHLISSTIQERSIMSVDDETN